MAAKEDGREHFLQPYAELVDYILTHTTDFSKTREALNKEVAEACVSLMGSSTLPHNRYMY